MPLSLVFVDSGPELKTHSENCQLTRDEHRFHGNFAWRFLAVATCGGPTVRGGGTPARASDQLRRPSPAIDSHEPAPGKPNASLILAQALCARDLLEMSSAQLKDFTVGRNEGRWRALAELVRERRQVTHDLRRERLEQGHDLQTDADSEESAIGVGGIGCDFDLVPLEVGCDIRSASADQRANERLRSGRQNRQPTGAGAAEEPQDHRLRAIVCVVSRRNQRALVARGRCGELGEPCSASARLKIAPCSDVDLGSPKADS